MQHLARKSFGLHREIAAELGAQLIDYRKLKTYSLSVGASSCSEGRKLKCQPPPEEWIDANIVNSDVIGTQETTAQVHPRKITEALMSSAVSRGASLQIGTVIGLKFDQKDSVQATLLSTGEEIPTDIVVVAMGPWSDRAFPFFPRAKFGRMSAHRCHSVVLKSQSIGGQALFCDIDGKEPEMYPRPDGTVYFSGESDDVPLPADPADIKPDSSACRKLKEQAAKVSGHLKDAPTLAEQACYLPCVSDGIPMIGKIPGYNNSFMATGHGCWGILNGPATGLAVTELITDTPEKSLDLSKFDPARFAKN